MKKNKIKHDREGRPTKYDEKEFQDKLKKYLKIRQDDVESFTNNRGGISRVWQVKLPTIEGFAEYMGVMRRTLQLWEKQYPNIVGKGLDQIRNKQLQRLIDEGLGGNYNSSIVKLLLSHNHGIKEETSTELKGEIINKFDDQQLTRIAQRISTRGGSTGNPSGEEKSD